MLDKTKGFNFLNVRNRLPLFNGDLNKTIVSLQREDYLALLEAVDVMVDNNQFDNNQCYKDIDKAYLKRIYRQNLHLAYLSFFNVLTKEDKDYIQKAFTLYKRVQFVARLV